MSTAFIPFHFFLICYNMSGSKNFDGKLCKGDHNCASAATPLIMHSFFRTSVFALRNSTSFSLRAARNRALVKLAAVAGCAGAPIGWRSLLSGEGEGTGCLCLHLPGLVSKMGCEGATFERVSWGCECYFPVSALSLQKPPAKRGSVGKRLEEQR